MSLALMRRNQIVKLLKDHRHSMEQFGVRGLALFGSAARDRMTASSDVDLLVEFEGRPTFDRYAHLLTLLEDLLGCRVDLVTVQSVREAMRQSIENDAFDVPGFHPVSSRHSSGL